MSTVLLRNELQVDVAGSSGLVRGGTIGRCAHSLAVELGGEAALADEIVPLRRPEARAEVLGIIMVMRREITGPLTL